MVGNRVPVNWPVPWLSASIGFKWTGYMKPMMLIDRYIFTDRSTVGKLYLDDKFFCYTLEDTCRADGKKIYGSTAIPAGTYRIILSVSDRLGNRFGWKELPEILAVPGFNGIRIHPFNTPEQTLGCIGPGISIEKDRVDESRKAFDKLMPRIQQYLTDNKLYLTIKGGRPA